MENSEIPKELLGGKREEYLQIDATYMGTALVWASRSKDPSTQVGACFVNSKGRIISVGYNGSPNSWDDDEFPWRRGEKDEDPFATKYPYVIHAEMNGILNYDGSSSDFNGSTIYVTLFPCSNCAKFLVQRGIKKVIYLTDLYKGTSDNKSAKLLFDKCGVEYTKFSNINVDEVDHIDLNFNPIERENPVRIKKMVYKIEE